MSDDDNVPGLPQSIEMAWGLRERPGKGPRRGLSLDRIVQAGVRVAVEEGLPAVSMGRVASELGVSTMALYRYVSSKDDLLLLMVDSISAEPPPLPSPGEHWRPALERWAWSIRAILLRNTWAVRVPISGPPAMPNDVAWMEAALRCLRDTGLDGGAKISILLLLSAVVRNDVLLTADLEAALRASGTTEQEVLQGYGQLLARVADPLRFPAIHELIKDGVFNETDGPDDEFAFALERVLDGIEMLVTRAGGRRGEAGS